MVAGTGTVLNAAQQRQLTALQSTARSIDSAQLRLATGKEVNSVLDGPGNFFAARGLDNEAQDLARLLDGIDKSIETIELVQHSLEALQTILDTADSFLLEYRNDLINGEVDVQETLDTSYFIEFSAPGDLINYAGGQDSGVPATIIESGYGIRLDDNSWRRLAVNQTITADTVLEFDFLSTNIPEIAAIGFDNDTNFSNSNNQFFLYGTQTTGISYSAPTPTYQYDGSGEWVHVQIPVGTYFTGNFSHLTFIDDDDGGGDDGDAQFRNIVIHQGEYVYGQNQTTVADTYEEKYNAILSQYDQIVQDSHYRGVNLLEGNTLTTDFNAHRTSSLTTEGLEALSGALDLERQDFTTVEAIDRKLVQVREAREILRHYASSLAIDYSILSQRHDFTSSMINVLQEGSDQLTLADQNHDGAELLALQTRQQIQISVLSLSNVSPIANLLG